MDIDIQLAKKLYCVKGLVLGVKITNLCYILRKRCWQKGGFV